MCVLQTQKEFRRQIKNTLQSKGKNKKLLYEWFKTLTDENNEVKQVLNQ